MRRGEIWTVAGGGDYTGKPRPAVIVQSDHITNLDSVTVCSLTTDETSPSVVRLTIEPTALNGLLAQSQIMVDKVSTVHRSRLGARVGKLSADEVDELDGALAWFLGLDAPFTAE